MSDVIDQGCDAEDADRAGALERQLQCAKWDGMQPRGTCYNCFAPIERGYFCDGDCRDDFARRKRAKKLNR